MYRSLREHVRQRALDRCEYCQLPQSCTTLPHEADHIRSQKLGGATTASNLCWACAQCNWSKGPNAAGFDPESDQLTRLYDPRIDTWSHHFRWIGSELAGRTAIGRTTIAVLNVNLPERVEHRRMLILLGKFTPITDGPNTIDP